MFFIFGLGNPGKKYKYTRHNLGFWVVEEMAKKYGVSFWRRRCFSRMAVISRVFPQPVALIKPQTFMNLSGRALFCFQEKYRFSVDKILVICDDLSIPAGFIRFKARGSSGGHKGLGSIISALNTEEFPRLRVGIGPVTEGFSYEEFVLQELTSEEVEIYRRITAHAVSAVEIFITAGIEKVMAEYNRRKLI